MQTQLAPEYQNTLDGRTAEAILRRCVHCGFCTATCPTYQLLGDELDGPRGRIYLIKQVLEGQTPTRKTQLHLDRCLTCRSCESTCPSGVEYGHLLDIGRKLVDAQVPRPRSERAMRFALKEGITSSLFDPALKLGQQVRGWLPERLQTKVPLVQAAGAWPRRIHSRKVLMLAGCAQTSMAPNINSATARVLDAAGIQTLVAPKAGCCGAVKFHLNDQDGGKTEMRVNVDAWWPLVVKESNGIEAIVMNASGCGSTVKDYAHILRDDAAYAEKAGLISAMTRDLSELLPSIVSGLLENHPNLVQYVRHNAPKLAFHPPCSLQHGQKLKGGVETYLGQLGFDVQIAQESHLCCGSAGTYSVLQPTLANQLRERKLDNLHALEQDIIISANMGCITHLQSGTRTPVRHWVEVLDDVLTRSSNLSNQRSI